MFVLKVIVEQALLLLARRAIARAGVGVGAPTVFRVGLSAAGLLVELRSGG
jgi:hypothetical protein